jgi:HEAT repeat protein
MTRAVVLSLGLLLVGCSPPEPTWGGKTPSAWRKDLQSTDSNVRAKAAGALGHFEGKETTAAIPNLIACLHDGHPGVRREAAWTLGSMGRLAADAVPEMNKLLKDPDVEVRAAAAEALSNIASKPLD